MRIEEEEWGGMWNDGRGGERLMVMERRGESVCDVQGMGRMKHLHKTGEQTSRGKCCG